MRRSDGWYANAGLSHTFAFTEKLGLALGANLGWGDANYHDFYFGKRRNRLSDLLLSSSLNYAVNKNLSLSLCLKYSNLVDAGIRRAARRAYGDANVAFAGVNATLAF